MKVNMDGLRRALARAYTHVVDGYHDAIEGRTFDIYPDLKDGLDEMRQIIGSLMCVYSDDPDELMTDLGDECGSLPRADPKDDEA